MVFLVGLLCVVTSFPAIPANAYVLSEYNVWLGDTIRYIPHEDFGSLSVSHMNEALYEWNEAMDAGYLGRYPSYTHDDSDYPNRDNQCKVYRLNRGQNGVLGANYVWHNTSTKMVLESDIYTNMSYTWANSAQPGKYDYWTFFMHEAGHSVGIGDNRDVPDAVMYYKIDPNTEKRTLRVDDRNAIKAIYGYVVYPLT